MTEMSSKSISRRTFVRGAAWSVPAVGLALTAPRVLAAPPGSQDCGDPNELIENCVVQLPEEFTSTSFSTTAVVGGTNYSILFSTNIRPGPLVPAAATGYRINSTGLTGTKRDGVPFSITPHIGEAGPRVLGARSGSSLGFVVDVPWTAGQLVRNFAYTFDVVYLNGLTEIQTCSYVTAMTLAENGMIVGGVGSVTFSPPRLTACNG
ncbi:hypothetical protein A5772_14875 [Mycolicibacter sinensis]|uniref:Secreted protein n=2 Tax=Mycolicibacter sinensis (strain JDM601) TaxID=875328 RepID=A0A1A2F3U8_MYCSD|nr:hypothetical protein A5772_14875 [Mycolicibacter sinensis]OBG11130.1 hypothetical protein A5771_00230 [Mycolicibacter sinensis]